MAVAPREATRRDDRKRGAVTVDVLCFSHLRWGFVYQRPNHLMERCARQRRVFFIEEPVPSEEPGTASVTKVSRNLFVVTPRLAPGLDLESAWAEQRKQLDALIGSHAITEYVAWYYTPHALNFSAHLAPVATVYDCMDELTGFHGASPMMSEWEARLFQRADLAFTGGQSLFEAKRAMHGDIHVLPSSVDRAHFARARNRGVDPRDQAKIPFPRIGYFGVIDERLDLKLIADLAAARPSWQLVLIGPTAKIDPASLPQGENIHYLGMKDYGQLPEYLANWDMAMMPFARNDATRFISPTKTLEYLAAGKEVVSTPIRDVVHPYGTLGLVRIASTTTETVEAIEGALSRPNLEREALLDEFLESTSWDRTWAQMSSLLTARFPAIVRARKPG